RRRVFGCPHHAYPFGVLGDRGALGMPGDHGDLVTGGREGGGEGVYVPAQAAYHDRWVLPREHQHPHPRPPGRATPANPPTRRSAPGGCPHAWESLPILP